MAIKRYKWQLSRVGKDIVRLQSLKEKHMADPFEFLRQLKAKVQCAFTRCPVRMTDQEREIKRDRD